MDKITGVVQNNDTADLYTVRVLNPIPTIKELRAHSLVDADGLPMTLSEAKYLSEKLRAHGYFLVHIEDVTEDGKAINPYGY